MPPTVPPPNNAESATSIVLLPAATSPLARGCKFVLVQTAGNMGLVMADGTTNDADLVAVEAGQLFPFSAIARSVSNTAVLLALS
jgi:hypothetical protein